MKGVINEEFLNNVLRKIIGSKNIYSAVLCLESGDNSLSWTGAAGNMEKESRFFIASVTKLYVTALIMLLVEENRINLNESLSKYLPDYYCEGLHVLNGIDYSDEITVNHLISNTSGLPDYFFHKQSGGRTAASKLLEGNDEP